MLNEENRSEKGIKPAVVREQLTILKASGDYARIIGEVEEEIAREEDRVPKGRPGLDFSAHMFGMLMLVR